MTDGLMVGELTDELDNIERIDRLITIAENRRNGMLREIDRRRAAPGKHCAINSKKLRASSSHRQEPQWVLEIGYGVFFHSAAYCAPSPSKIQ